MMPTYSCVCDGTVGGGEERDYSTLSMMMIVIVIIWR